MIRQTRAPDRKQATRYDLCVRIERLCSAIEKMEAAWEQGDLDLTMQAAAAEARQARALLRGRDG